MHAEIWHIYKANQRKLWHSRNFSKKTLIKPYANRTSSEQLKWADVKLIILPMITKLGSPLIKAETSVFSTELEVFGCLLHDIMIVKLHVH